jgi:hypothetical protein
VQQIANRLFRLEPGEWPKLLQFGLFGFLLQMGMGIGFSAGDAAFLGNVGADSLPLIFILTPVVMLLYTAVFSYLTVRFSIGHLVDLTLALLIAGGATLWALVENGLSPGWETTVYFALKLYLAVWYIGLYTLFWNFTDSFFDIQDAKRFFPLFAAFCALGTATGAILVSLLAGIVAMHDFFLGWAVLAFFTAPVAHILQARWTQIAESDLMIEEAAGDAARRLTDVGKAFAGSRYAMVLALTLFATLLLTNLAEFQYSTVLQQGRSEAELAALFGALYAAANLFNMVVCLLVFNRLVARIGVRNVALIQPFTYFAVFGYFFLEGGASAAFAAFFAYHGILTSIQYNNENLLFNALPSQVKRPMRTVIEGICEPAASLAAGGFLLVWSEVLDIRALSGLGIIASLALIAVVAVLRQAYPAAMATNMRRGWLNFGQSKARTIAIAGAGLQRLEAAADGDGTQAGAAAQRLLMALYKAKDPAPGDDRAEALTRELVDRPAECAAVLDKLAAVAGPEHFHQFNAIASVLPQLATEQRHAAIAIIGQISDTEMIPDILALAIGLAPRDRRAVAAVLVDIGETAIPHLTRALGDSARPLPLRALAARALAELSYAQFSARLDRLVQNELRSTHRLLGTARLFDSAADPASMITLIARAQRERAEASVDFVLELLSLGRRLPDADLLIVSLHSANAKVRGNAVEAIESGVDHQTYALLRAVLNPAAAAPESSQGSIAEALRETLLHGPPIEAAGALDTLARSLPREELTRLVQPLMKPGLPRVLRDKIGAVFGQRRAHGPDVLDIVSLLAKSARFGAVPLLILLELADRARFAAPPGPAHLESDDGLSVWIPERDIRELAARHPSLALILLRQGAEDRHAA